MTITHLNFGLLALLVLFISIFVKILFKLGDLLTIINLVHGHFVLLFFSSLQDSFEMDEDINFDKSASQLAEGRDKRGISGAEKNFVSTDEALSKPAALSETNATLGILNKRNDMEAPDAALISVSSPSFLPSSDPLSLEVVPPSFGSNKSKDSSSDKVPALLFSSSFPLSGLKPESLSRLVPT